MASKNFRPLVVGRFHVYRLAFISTAEDASEEKILSLGFDDILGNMQIDPKEVTTQTAGDQRRLFPAVLLNNLEISDNMAVSSLLSFFLF